MIQFIQVIKAAEQDQVAAEEIELLIREQLTLTVFNTAELRELLTIANRLNLTDNLQGELHYDLFLSYGSRHVAVLVHAEEMETGIVGDDSEDAATGP
jgi:hypothetical protein